MVQQRIGIFLFLMGNRIGMHPVPGLISAGNIS